MRRQRPPVRHGWRWSGASTLPISGRILSIALPQLTPSSSASASSACSKQASGALTVPAPIWPIPASLWAIPVLMSGVMPVSTTRRISSPRQAPGNPSRNLQLHIALKEDFRHLLRNGFRRLHSAGADKTGHPGPRSSPRRRCRRFR